MFSEPVKLIFVNILSTSALEYVFENKDDNSSPIASISFLFQKLGLSRPPDNSILLFNELRIAIG